MARPLRIEYPGALYHVMNRGNDRQRIFRSEKDYHAFLKLLSESVRLWNLEIYAFSLIPNHYHLLLSTPLGNLSRAMRHIDGVYTQRFNRHWKRDGHLFRGRYKAILVEEDAYLVELIRYVHLNPVMAQIVKEPQDHPWTSHRNYLEKDKLKWLNRSRLLSYFGQRVNLARRKLHEFVLEGVPPKLYKQLKGKKWPSVYSSDNFRKWVEWNFVKDMDDREITYEAKESTQISEKQLKDIITTVFDMDWQGICDASGREAKLLRGIAICYFRNYLKYEYSKLSLMFGGIHPTNISRAVGRRPKKYEKIFEILDLEIQNAKRKT